MDFQEPRRAPPPRRHRNARDCRGALPPGGRATRSRTDARFGDLLRDQSAQSTGASGGSAKTYTALVRFPPVGTARYCRPPTA